MVADSSCCSRLSCVCLSVWRRYVSQPPEEVLLSTKYVEAVVGNRNKRTWVESGVELDWIWYD